MILSYQNVIHLGKKNMCGDKNHIKCGQTDILEILSLRG
jgi:hypothetical protein